MNGNIKQVFLAGELWRKRLCCLTQTDGVNQGETTVKSLIGVLVEPKLEGIPHEVLDSRQFFDLSLCSDLPPHLEWDCTIKLKDNCQPKQTKQYLLGEQDQKQLQQYV